jgi:hypothetical protein
MSLSGVVKVNYGNGRFAIVSRRYMNKIKSQILMTRK